MGPASMVLGPIHGPWACRAKRPAAAAAHPPPAKQGSAHGKKMNSRRRRRAPCRSRPSNNNGCACAQAQDSSIALPGFALVPSLESQTRPLRFAGARPEQPLLLLSPPSSSAQEHEDPRSPSRSRLLLRERRHGSPQMLLRVGRRPRSGRPGGLARPAGPRGGLVLQVRGFPRSRRAAAALEGSLRATGWYKKFVLSF